MVKLKKVVSDDLYEQINSYVESNKIIVEDYEGMVNTILRMTKDGYCFTMDRDILRDAMESLTYMYAPDDDMNKDRLTQQLVDDEEDDDSSEEGGDDFANMDLMKMMQMTMEKPFLISLIKVRLTIGEIAVPLCLAVFPLRIQNLREGMLSTMILKTSTRKGHHRLLELLILLQMQIKLRKGSLILIK